uniref:Probable E3 ubiquitin-protein ligase XERICO n=1 Tax=Elaeis guineensis var. tenera TaxID=51953 RepID=A0A8N4F3L1_ELAGV|nr:probable E3 ubiquitin-protein ligase XERICO [Elaeis guineensis]
MAFGFYYFSLPRPYVYLLELIGLIKFMIFMASRHLGSYLSSSSPASSRENNNACSELDAISSQASQMTSESVKERLPVVEFGSLVERWRLGEEIEHVCTICMRCLDGGHEVRELGNCAHAFHRACLDLWVDEGRWTCPLCRSKLTPEGTSMGL